MLWSWSIVRCHCERVSLYDKHHTRWHWILKNVLETICVLHGTCSRRCTLDHAGGHCSSDTRPCQENASNTVTTTHACISEAYKGQSKHIHKLYISKYTQTYVKFMFPKHACSHTNIYIYIFTSMQASHANMNAFPSCTFTFPWHWVLKQSTLILYLRSKNGLSKPAVGQLCFPPAATPSL